MKQLLHTIQELKTQARINQKSLNEMGFPISYMQSLQVVAKSHGYKSWEVIQTKALKDELVIDIHSSDEIELNTELSNSLWIKIGNISVSVRDNQDNINVSFYNYGSEDTDGIDFYADKAELENLKNDIQDENEDDSYYDAKLIESYLIKEEYYNSKKSKKDLNNAIERLICECNEHYSSEESAKEFILEPLIIYELKSYFTQDDYNNRISNHIDDYYDINMAIKEADLLASKNNLYKVVIVERTDIDGGSYVYETSSKNNHSFKKN